MRVISWLLSAWVDFFAYVGIYRTAIAVVSFYLLLWAMKKLPEQLEKKDTKLSRFLLTNIGKPSKSTVF